MRTAQLDGAHVEYFRGIANPIGVKIGPAMNAEWLQGAARSPQSAERARPPHADPPLGRKGHRAALPPLIEAVRATGSTVLWICDPMHGNTETTPGGFKTRRFDNILSELESAFRIHEELGSILGGVHFELTGEDVTECIGGARGLDRGGPAARLPIAASIRGSTTSRRSSSRC